MRITLDQAAHLLSIGEVIGVPTETVYGLAASISHPEAINRIFLLKGRPSNNPLIIHIHDAAALKPYVETFPSHFDELAAAFWPGPLTLVLPIVPSLVPEAIRSGLPTAAFRVPELQLARELLAKTGPLVMPSANLSGMPSSTRYEHVESDFGNAFPVLDGGPCKMGLESTILIFHEGKWKIIRLGAIAEESFKPILGYVPAFLTGPTDRPLCPGQMFRHYAPHAKLIMTHRFYEPMEGAVIGFSDRSYPSTCQLFPLGPLSQPERAAQSLYHVLRTLDEQQIKCAWVDMNFPSGGLWETLRERLYKAAQKE